VVRKRRDVAVATRGRPGLIEAELVRDAQVMLACANAEARHRRHMIVKFCYRQGGFEQQIVRDRKGASTRAFREVGLLSSIKE
jgi:hypothetical protein